MKTINITGAINADTVYCDGSLEAQDVKISLPEITPATTEVQMMGTMDMPIRGRIEDMEASITKIGIDKGLGKICRFTGKTIEVRWTQDVIQTDGSTKLEGCKAFLRVIPKVLMPGLDIEPGESTEAEIPLCVTRYQLFAGGEEIALVDRFAHICRIYGTDCYKGISNLL